MVATAAGTGLQAVKKNKKLRITLIAVVSEDGFISAGTGGPWDLPADRAHFRARTAGRWLLLGRRTYGEMTGWFHNHHPLVLSRDPDFHPDPGERVTSMEEAMERTRAAGIDELVVVGGSHAFEVAMPWATHLDLTRVHTRLHQGVRFPDFDPHQWTQVQRMEHPVDDRHAFAFTFTESERAADNG